MKTITFLPDTIQETNQIIDLVHPSLDGKKSKIQLVLSNNETDDSQNIFWLQETKLGKSPEGKDLTVKSTFFNNVNDIKKGGIMPNDSFKFCTLYDLSFSIIAYLFKENKLNFMIGKDESNKFETLNDIHLSLYEKSDKNWKFIKTSKVKESLLKICHFIEEDHGEETKELFFKVTKQNFMNFFEKKLNNITDNFPENVMKKILEKYPLLNSQEENIGKEAKLFFSLQLITSLIPFDVYVYLNKEFSQTLYPAFIKYKEVDNVLANEALKEQQLLLQSARNVGSTLNRPNDKKLIKTSVNTIPTNKKRKVVNGTVGSNRVSVGALDSFFKPKK